MVKRHMKRIAAPRTWPIERKWRTYISRPNPGTHPMDMSISLGTLMKEIIKNARNSREVKVILSKKSVLVDGKKRTDERFPVGLFDAVSFPDVNEHYRVTINTQGKIAAIPIDKNEADKKICKIVGKSMVSSKMQLNLSDGRNILADKSDNKIGDCLILEVPSQKIKKHIAFAKGATIMLTGGKNFGAVGTIEDTSGSKIMYKTANGAVSETLKKYAFIVGEGKPAIKIA